MFLILDTTEFYDSPLADSNSFKLLQEYIQKTQSRLLMPEAVLKELINHTRERLIGVDKALDKASREYERVKCAAENTLTIQRPNFDLALVAYEAKLRKTLEQSFRAVILPLPIATHSQVLDRALKRRIPFRDKDGYRDTLIWLTVAAEIAQHPGEYVFVTNNTKDFIEGDLIAELGVLPNGCSLKFEKDLTSFIKNHAEAVLEKLNALLNTLTADQALPGFDLAEELADPSPDVLRRMSSKLRIRGYRYRSIEEPYYIQSYDAPEDIQVDQVYAAQDDVIVECTALYSCTVSGYLFHSEAAALPVDGDIHVTDWNWNEHYAEVEFTENVEVRFLIRLAEDEAPENGAAQEYSMQSIEVLEANLDEDP